MRLFLATVFCIASNLGFSLNVIAEDNLPPTTSSPISKILDASDLTPVQQTLGEHKCGYINENYEYIIQPQFGSCGRFAANGLAAARTKNGKVGYINPRGELVLPAVYQDAGEFDSRGYASVKQNDKWGFITSDGKFLIKPQFEWVKDFLNNQYAAIQQNEKWGFINRKGKVVIPPQYDGVPGRMTCLSVVNKDRKWYYIHGDGTLTPTTEYLYVIDGCTLNGLVPYEEKNGKWGFLNSDGVAIKPIFDGTGPFAANGLAMAGKDKKYGYIDSTGKFIISPQFAQVAVFADDGLARVKLGEKWGIINAEGDFVIQPVYDDDPPPINESSSRVSFGV